MPLAQGYLTSFAKDDGLLSAAGITPRMAVVLHTLARRMPEKFYYNILSPVNIIERLSAWDRGKPAYSCARDWSGY